MRTPRARSMASRKTRPPSGAIWRQVPQVLGRGHRRPTWLLRKRSTKRPLSAGAGDTADCGSVSVAMSQTRAAFRLWPKVAGSERCTPPRAGRLGGGMAAPTLEHAGSCPSSRRTPHHRLRVVRDELMRRNQTTESRGRARRKGQWPHAASAPLSLKHTIAWPGGRTRTFAQGAKSGC